MSVLKPVVSVVVPLYNGALLIQRCLDSIFKQKGDFDLEVIVIDDGSTDDSVEIVKNYQKPIIFLSQTNHGAASARNKGIFHATGEYLAFLDADDYWLPEFLNLTLKFLQKNPDTIAVNTGQTHKIPGQKDNIVPEFLADDKPKYNNPFVLDRFYAFWAEHQHVCTGSVLIRTETAKKTGGQLAALRISQDLEFWAFLGTFGKWGFIPEILFVSDGGKVTQQRGWLKKNSIRWKATPSIDTFTRRTLSRISKIDRKDFDKVIGWVAYNFTYGHIMAKKFDNAYYNIKQFSEEFPKNRIKEIYVFTTKFGKTGFYFFSFFLRSIQILRQNYIHRFKS